MAHRLGAMLVLGSESLCKSTKTMLWHCDFWWWRKGCREAVLNISFRQKRLEQKSLSIKNVEAQCAMDQAKPGNQENSAVALPSWWLPKSVVVPTKKVNMYIVGCFDSHFAIASNWLAVKRNRFSSACIQAPPNSSYFPVRTNDVLSGMGWCGQAARKGKSFF